MKSIKNKIIRFFSRKSIKEDAPLFYTKDFFKNKKFQIGDFTYGNPTVFFEEEADLIIGKFCSIAFNSVEIYLGGNHHTEWVTTYPFNKVPGISLSQDIDDTPTTKGNVVIGNDVWIGRDVVILSGVHIGDGAVIGAGAIVSKDVPPYSIVVGNPAKVVKKRFSEETIQNLLRLAWWDWPIEKIMAEVPMLMNEPDKYFLMKDK